MTLLDSRDRIRTLRAVGRLRDPLALRLALDRALGATELHPADLPRGAVLCVRRMRIALPAGRGERWTEAMTRQMPDLIRHAARPSREHVSNAADAVVFMDEAELLACLARDWRAGRGDAWWWRGIFAEAPSERLVRKAWLDAPTIVPAAIERLASARLAPNVVRALPQDYCEQLLHRVAAAFAIAASSAGQPPQARGEHADVHEWMPAQRVLLRHWIAIDGELHIASYWPELAPAQRAILGLSLLIRRAPRVARLPDVVELLRREDWVAKIPAAEHGAEPLFRDAVPDDPARTVQSKTDKHEHAAGSDGHQSPAVAVQEVALVGSRHSPKGASSEPAFQLVAAALVASSTTETANPPDLSTPPEEALCVESEYAGVVYLINIALHLGLYADFSHPAADNLPIPLGEFLALVGEKACGDAFRADAIRDLLAVLAGRETNATGAIEARTDWIDELAERLAAPAALALGVISHEALPFLCANAGRVELTSTRLDVNFPLASHPLEIRLAGLDRDPGWVPAAGRVIAFHYE